MKGEVGANDDQYEGGKEKASLSFVQKQETRSGLWAAGEKCPE